MSAELNNLRPFRFWCQKVLPLVYDDSLSYYELLNKVVKYLNDVTENVNSLGTAFQELEESLDHYVNDVVEERLDQMVEDGTLDDIVSEVLTDKFNAYTTATNARISTLETTVNNHGTSLSDQSSRITAIENTLASSMVTLPHLYAETINAPNQFNKESMTAWLRYVTSHYGTQLGSRPFMGKYTAYITMLIIGFAYHFTNLINGLPDFSEFIILAWGGTHLYTFGTNNGEVYFKATDTLTPITDTSTLNASSGTRVEKLTVDSAALAREQLLQAELTKMDEATTISDLQKPSVQKPVVNESAEQAEEAEPEVAAEAEEVSEEYEEMPEAEPVEEDSQVEAEEDEPQVEDPHVESEPEPEPEDDVNHPDTEGQEI